MAAELTGHGADVTVHPASEPTAAQIEATVDASAGHDVAVVLTQSGGFAPSAAQQALVTGLAASDVPVAQVAVRNPYDVASTAQTAAAVATYSYADVSLEAAARVLMGQVNPVGRLPVAIPDGADTLFPLGHGLHLPVTPEPPAFVDRTGRGQDTYEIPAAQGVDYLVGDRVVAPGTYRSTRDVTVTAVAQEGYELVGGATRTWESAFTAGPAGR